MNHRVYAAQRMVLGLGRLVFLSMIALTVFSILTGCGSTPAQPATVLPAETVASTAAPVASTAVPDAATPTAAPNPTATPTQAPTATSLPDGMMFTDDFSSEEVSSNNGWGMTSNDTADYDWSSNQVVISVNKSHWIAWNMPDDFYVNFAAELEAQPVDNGYAEYGIIFRAQTEDTPSFYNFGVNTNGEYYLSKKIADVWADPDPVSFTTSRYVKRGTDKNKIGVVAKGSQISLYINGFLVKTLTDDELGRGKAGVFVETRDEVGNRVAFNRFTIYTVAKAQANWGTTLAADAKPTPTRRPLATKAPATPVPTKAPVAPAPTKALPAPTRAAPAAGTSVTVRNTFDQSCRIVFWGPADVTIDVGHDQSVTRAITPGTYGWRAFIGGGQTGEAGNLNIFNGATCNFVCDKDRRAIRWSCR